MIGQKKFRASKGMGNDCGATRLQKFAFDMPPELQSIFPLSFIMEC
jgi:hypothetical protein